MREAERFLEDLAARRNILVRRMIMPKWFLHQVALPDTAMPEEKCECIAVGLEIFMTVSAELDTFTIMMRRKNNLSEAFSIATGKLVGIRPMQELRILSVPFFN